MVVDRPVVDAASLLDDLPDAVLLVDTEARLIWGNRAAEQLFGRTLEDSIGMSGLDLVHPDDLELATVSLLAVVDKEVGTPLELRVRTSTGWRLVELVGAPGEGGVVMVLRDLTERRRWEVAQDEEAQFRSLLQNAAAVTILLDAHGCVRSSSTGFTRLLGLDQAWMEGRPITELVRGRDRAALGRALHDLCAGSLGAGGRVELDASVRRGDGTILPVSIELADLLDDPTVEGIVVTVHDITRRVRAEDELRTANSLLAATLDATADGVLVVDLEGRVTSSNQRFAEMWGIPATVVEEGSDDELLALASAQLRHPDSFRARVAELYHEPDAESHDLVEFQDGRIFERESRPQLVDGQIIGRVWSFRDVTAHRQLQQELTRQASHDPLTGLANQTLFREQVSEAADALVGDDRLAVLFIDLDDFKTVNDSLGHSAGDLLLMSVSDRLRNCVRVSDHVARLGGDEFAVLVSALESDEEAIDIAERVLRVLAEPIMVAERPMATGASVGVAFGTAGEGTDELLRNADLAMYHAKNSGRNQYRVYEPEMHDAAVRRLEVDSRLRGASGRGELVVDYQPIVELPSGRIKAVEALVRWHHPERGLLMPQDFVPFAEASGIIDEVGHHVLLMACQEASEWGRVLGERAAPAVTVNVSPRQLLDDRLPGRVAEVLEHCGMDPSRLVLEITEGALMQDPAAATRRLEHLTRVGVRLAVDDFGTGHSSLAHLQRFPIDTLKIDRSFVTRVEEHTGASLVRAIVQLAHTLDMTTIAEGVEDAAQRDRVASLGCDLAQGWFFMKPCDVDAIRTAVLTGLTTGVS